MTDQTLEWHRVMAEEQTLGTVDPTATDYEWEGWPLATRHYDGEFDLAARMRMVEGGRLLASILDAYRHRIGPFILETGPFFTPLVTADRFPLATIVYWENDPHALKWLGAIRNSRGHTICCDLNRSHEPSFLDETTNLLQTLGRATGQVDTVVASQVLNYTDHVALLAALARVVRPDGLLFVNNVVDYGLPPFFSPRRPCGLDETVSSIEAAGFVMMSKWILPSTNPKHQKHPRLLLVAHRAR